MINLKDSSKPSGPVMVGNLKITIDRDLCIGAATCNSIAAHTFGLDDDSKAVILDTSGKDSEEAIIEAARSCPVAAILIQRANGERVYPK